MDTLINIKAANIIKTDICLSASQGQKICDHLTMLLHEGQKVILSFKGTKEVIPLFFNVAIGQLYSKFDENKIKDHLQVVGLSEGDQCMLEKTIENAKKYHATPRQYDMAWEREGDV